MREGAPPHRSKRRWPLGQTSLIPVGTGRYGESRSHRIVLRRHHRGGFGQCNAGEHRLRSRAGEPFATVTSAPTHQYGCGRVSTLKRNAQGPTKHNHAASRREALRCRTTSNDRTFPSPTPHHAHTAPPHVLDIREGCPPRAASRARGNILRHTTTHCPDATEN